MTNTRALRGPARARVSGRLAALLGLLAAAWAPSLQAQRIPGQPLTVDAIFGSAEFQPSGLPELKWTPDGDRFTWVQRGRRGGTDLVAMDPVTGRGEILVDGSKLVPAGAGEPLFIEGYDWGPEGHRLLIYTNSQRVWRENTKGTYYVYDMTTGTLSPVSTAEGWQQFAKFSPDGTKVGFVRDNDLYVVDLATGKERAVTHDGSDTIINGTFDWVYEEELGLRDGWRWSPDSRRIAYWRLDQSPIPEFLLEDQLKLYPEVTPIRYPKAGEPNSLVQIDVFDLQSGKTVRMDTGADPEAYLARMEWAESPDELVIQKLNRHQDTLTVMLADAATGSAHPILTEGSDTWVDVDLDFRWVNGGKQFLWTSERSGWDHLYLYNRDGSLARQLTDGDWDVDAPQGVSSDGWVYFTGAREGPEERYLYRVPLKGGDVERLTDRPGWHDVQMSPDARFYMDGWSRFGVPPEFGVFRGDGSAVRTLVDNAELKDRLASLDLGGHEFFTFTTSDGVKLNGWMIKPPDFDPSRKYPVLMYVYGGPGSQTVTDQWGGPEYLWHQMLAKEGYIVASVDNRGTGFRGRAFKNVTYLELGKWETHDQLEAARWLGSRPYVDAGRIGIWGWSYGGYMSLLSLFEGGDLFKAGISVAPVTNWKFYDTIYTERYLRTPQENPKGYAEGAPLSHVEGLDADLLLVHGTGDDNVHFQNSLELIDALEKAGKQFSLMIYPNKTHSISGDGAQVHLFHLLTDFLNAHLPVATPVTAHAGS